MDLKTIATLLSALATAPLVVGCAKPQPTQAPLAVESEHGAAETEGEHACGNHAEGEHACGNHAEGACGGMAAPDEPAPSEQSFSIAPGKFAEANFEMTEGSTITVTFSQGSDDIAWDVHSHGPSGETKVHDEGRGGEGTVEFKAPATGVFSVLWKNAGSTSTPLDVRVSASEGASIHSWMPAP